MYGHVYVCIKSHTKREKEKMNTQAKHKYNMRVKILVQIN